MTEIEAIVEQARGGDLIAYGKLVELTQQMVFAVCYRVLGEHADALDATQETYLRAFGKLADLHESAALPGWLRRIAVTTARNLARKRRMVFIPLADAPEVPVFDEIETAWTESERAALAGALMRLRPEDRRICDRFYHGGWDIARLAADANITESAMRKRLQRIRDQLREETEMTESQNARGISLPQNLSATVQELLARPRLIDLPDNPVGRITDLLRARYSDYQMAAIPEIVTLDEAREATGNHLHCLPREHIHFLDANRFLRYDTTIPLLLAAKNAGAPLRLAAAGQVYRNQTPSPTRDQLFHQLEILRMDEAASMSVWQLMGETLHIIADLLPDRSTRIETVNFPECTSAWEISVDVDGQWVVLSSLGVYSPQIVQHLGGNPARHIAYGLGWGLDRVAALHFGIDDIRKLAAARV